MKEEQLKLRKQVRKRIRYRNSSLSLSKDTRLKHIGNIDTAFAQKLLNVKILKS